MRKICRKCKKEKGLLDFSFQQGVGYTNLCKECVAMHRHPTAYDIVRKRDPYEKGMLGMGVKHRRKK
jgi:hypothetical protein